MRTASPESLKSGDGGDCLHCFTRLRTRNQAELDHYGKQAASFLAGHEIKWLAPFGRPFEVVEGMGAEGVALLEFPTLAAARAWYTSPAYQKASEHRYYSAMIVDGAASERLLAPWRPAASGESVQASL